MAGKRIRIGWHARFEMRRRHIKRAEVTATIRSPGQIVPSRKGREIYQSLTGSMLLRVVVKEDKNVYHVVTAYRTSKVRKYWGKP